jgi:hypothetical protein
MISKQTSVGVLATIVSWAKKHGLKQQDIESLFLRLEQVRGNQSFNDSIKGILKLLGEHKDIWDMPNVGRLLEEK